jgi:hypothetical protein
MAQTAPLFDQAGVFLSEHERPPFENIWGNHGYSISTGRPLREDAPREWLWFQRLADSFASLLEGCLDTWYFVNRVEKHEVVNHSVITSGGYPQIRRRDSKPPVLCRPRRPSANLPLSDVTHAGNARSC